jgi:hypothetical protein
MPVRPAFNNSKKLNASRSCLRKQKWIRKNILEEKNEFCFTSIVGFYLEFFTIVVRFQPESKEQSCLTTEEFVCVIFIRSVYSSIIFPTK